MITMTRCTAQKILDAVKAYEAMDDAYGEQENILNAAQDAGEDTAEMYDICDTAYAMMMMAYESLIRAIRITGFGRMSREEATDIFQDSVKYHELISECEKKVKGE